MSRFKDTSQTQTLLGDPITIGDVTMTSQSQALTIRWPRGGWVWHRPVAVLVERDGGTERIPIVDVTRVGVSVLCDLCYGAIYGTFCARKESQAWLKR